MTYTHRTASRIANAAHDPQGALEQEGTAPCGDARGEAVLTALILKRCLSPTSMEPVKHCGLEGPRNC
jgi:hypothetical protein